MNARNETQSRPEIPNRPSHARTATRRGRGGRLLHVALAALVFVFSAANGPCEGPTPDQPVRTEIDEPGLAEEPRGEETPALGFDNGSGPASLVGFELFVDEGEYGLETVAIVYLDEASYGRVLDDPAFQVRVYLDDPAGDAIAFYSGGRTWLVSEQFRPLEWRSRVGTIDELSALTLTLPPCPEAGCSGVAELAWDDAPQHRHLTPLDGLPYFGFTLGTEDFPPMGNDGGDDGEDEGGRPMSEIFMSTVPADGCRVVTTDRCPRGQLPPCDVYECGDGVQTSGSQVDESGVKHWPAGEGEAGPHPNAPADHPVYRGWPKTPVRGGFTFWEFEGRGGFIKYAQKDTNGNGSPDPGECWGFVGRCPFEPGKNSQAIGRDSSQWTSEHDGHGKRIVYELRVTEDGGCEVVATHQTLVNGAWENTRVGEGFENPIVGGPYGSEREIPAPASFGQSE